MTRSRLFRLSRALRRFRNDRSGIIALEAIILLPMMVFTFVMLFTFFHMYRAVNDHVKATFAVGDLISRENQPVQAAMIEGMRDIQRLASGAGTEAVWLRVSSFYYHGEDERFRLAGTVGSRSTNASRVAPLSDATVHTIEDRLPLAAPGDGLILVEAWRDYTPPFTITWGVFDEMFGPRVIRESVVMRPHFLSPLPIN
jgi:Flp pilus assembly protein TadG